MFPSTRLFIVDIIYLYVKMVKFKKHKEGIFVSFFIRGIVLFCVFSLLSSFFLENQAQFNSKRIGVLALTNLQEPAFQEGSKIPLSNSVLATGNWYKFYIARTGVHKISYQFLKDLGMDVSNIDPATIKIYGNGGAMLPLKNNENTTFDLIENPIKIVGIKNGELSENSYILFYGRGTRGYNSDSKTHINLYDDRSFYFITADGKKGKRVSEAETSIKNSDTLIKSFVDHQFYEIDEFNLGLMGRRWFGDKMKGNEEKSFSFNFPNKVDTASVDYTLITATQSNKPSRLEIEINGKHLEKISFPSSSNNVFAREGRLQKTFRTDLDSIRFGLKYFVNEKALGKAFIDYISVSTERLLIGTNKPLEFGTHISRKVEKIGTVQLSNAHKIEEVWDVTDVTELKVYKNHSLLNTFEFDIRMNQEREFISVSLDNLNIPLQLKESKVENQNLKGTVFLDDTGKFQDVDYLIITTHEMLRAANRLADFHGVHNSLKVKVVSLEKIYNEFSSGKKDIGAIRNFIRYVYSNSSEENKRVSYVCLMGNATIDYKNKLEGVSPLGTFKKNDVPSFISYNSFSNTRSYISDDFFVMMDPEEGTMQLKDDLDIVIGRILVNDAKQANEFVNKFIGYHQKSSLGDWRNDMLLLSDDMDKRWERGIQENLDKLSDSIAVKYPFLNISKIYTDTYLQHTSFSGQKYPKVTSDLIKRIHRGVAVVDYFGHAEEEGFGIEFFFTKKEARELENINRLPLFITVTCLATRFDNPHTTSVGEYLFKNPNGGAIGLIATTREIFFSSGVRINNKVIKSLFSENGISLKPAEAVLQLKNSSRFHDKRNVFFIGDPVMSLQLPSAGAQITHINNIPIDKFKDTLKVLDKVKISGQLINDKGGIKKSFEGDIQLTVFDKEEDRITLANDQIKDAKGNLIQMNYKSQDEIIVRSNARVKKGRFDVSFVLPKDMDIAVGKRKISLYAQEDNTTNDLFGTYGKVLMGGINNHVVKDIRSPKLKMLLGGKEIKDVNVINPNTKMKVFINDENGINLSEGLGHQIELIVNGNEQKKVILNNSFKNQNDTYKNGVIEYILKDIQPGYHSLSFKIWDNFNNSASIKTNVIMIDSEDLR